MTTTTDEAPRARATGEMSSAPADSRVALAREKRRTDWDVTEARRFADNVRRLRHQRSFSQERLAHVCGLHRTEISLLERCERDPRLSTIVRLARGLNVPPAALLENIE